jgi:HPt (histidine-containing phosphotransfer) domain-containing protein
VTAAILTVLHQILREGGNDTSIDKDKGKMKEESKTPWNMSKTLEQLGGDEALFREVIDIFLDQAPKHLAALLVAVEQGQAETVETTAHTLRGELGYLDIPETLQRASEIEEAGRSKDVSRVTRLLPQFEADINGLFTAIRSAKASGWNRI